MIREILLPAWTLWQRELVRFFRQRSRVAAALGTPLLFWLFLGSGLGTSFRLTGQSGELNYLEYFYPGTLLLVVLFTAVFSSLSLIEDRKEGYWLSVLVAPVSRSGPVLGKTLGGATLAFLQGMLLLALAPLVGIHPGPLQLLGLAGVIFLNAFAITCLGFAFAWRIDSSEGFHGVMNMVLFPMWLLSGALFPVSGASFWLRWAMQLNPLSYGLASLQHLLYDSSQMPAPLASPATCLVVISLFALVTFLLAFLLAQQQSARAVA